VNICGLDIGSCVRAADGFAAGGDAVVARLCGESVLLAVIDVLGHGPEAHQVAVRAEALLEGADDCDVVRLLARLEAELAGSIGAAVGIAVVRPDAGHGTFVGVGNTVARLFGRMERRLVSSDGIVGQRQVTARPVPFSLGVGDLILLHSDGITSRFESSAYPQLVAEDPATAARELVRRFGRSYDDAACIVARRTE
jgi:negative regulator of sigma-B (phosphoserine phosphatase)